MLEIRDLCEETMEVYLSCGCNPNDVRITDEIRSAQRIKKAWAERMLPQGLGAKIAYEHSFPAGFVEFLPIEVAPVPVEGKRLLFISDIHINDDDMSGQVNYERKGIGRRLIEQVEKYARDKGFIGLAALALDGDWMPAAFFLKVGFAEADKIGPMYLLWKPFGECEPPRIWKGNFNPTAGQAIVHIDVIYSCQCWGMVMQARSWRDVAAEFPGKVVVHEHHSDDRQVMSLDCMTGSIGVYIDGQWGPDHPIEKDEMRALVMEAVSRKTGPLAPF